MSDAAYEVQTVDRLVATINAGDDGNDATQDYRRLMETLNKYVEDYGGKHKGSLTIKLEFAADPKGVDVTMTSQATLPKRPTNKERFFISERGTLTLKDPGRDTLFPGADMGRKARRDAE